MRSSGAIVRREFMKMRAVWSAVAGLCADRKRPNRVLVDNASPAVETCCRKRRREDMEFLLPVKKRSISLSPRIALVL